MFPNNKNQCVPPLYTLVKNRMKILLINFIKSSACENNHSVHTVRKYIRHHLPGVILADLLAMLLPSQDKWLFPCTLTTTRLHCINHSECDLVYTRLERIIILLFSEDIQELIINLRKVNIEMYKPLFASVTSVMTRVPTRPFPLLTKLVVCGGSVHSDNTIYKVEELCRVLKYKASNLEYLHLPVASNTALRIISDMKKITIFRADRMKNFSEKGLHELCHPMSATKKGLRVLNLGVVKYSQVQRKHFARFLLSMNLVEFTCHDDMRPILRQVGYGIPDDQVMPYSIFKRARIEQQSSDKKVLVTDLRELVVVDRSLNPSYILESAPSLQRLTIDWQQELCLAPFYLYHHDWFTTMVSKPSWSRLSRQLTKLDITFPATYTINTYSLPVEDYHRLLQSTENLEELRLAGGGQGDPIPLLDTLLYCPHLKSLVLQETPVFIPGNMTVVEPEYVSNTLKKFSYLCETSSLLAHDSMMKSISQYMPALTELEVQPQTPLGYSGLTPGQIMPLANLQHLQKLSLPLSLTECSGDIPTLIVVLSNFPSLQFLTLSWAMWKESWSVDKRRIPWMMSYLEYGLAAVANTNINIQLSFKHHPWQFITKN